MKTIIQSLRMLAVLTVITGIAYPLLMTGVAQLALSHQANGSMITENGAVIGSTLVGQSFSSDKYFWPRPSAVGYNPVPSSGTNLGPTSQTLRDSVVARAARFGAAVSAVPADLLEASGSGLDPHISPEAAYLQIDRILKARGFPLSRRQELQTFVQAHIEPPQMSVLGEDRVNVLLLNMAMDSLK